MASNPLADWQQFIGTMNVAPDQRRAQLPSLVQQFAQKYPSYNAQATGVDHHGPGSGTDTASFAGQNYDLIHGGDNAWQGYQDNGPSSASGQIPPALLSAIMGRNQNLMGQQSQQPQAPPMYQTLLMQLLQQMKQQ